MPYHCRIQYILSFQIILRFLPCHIVKCIKSFHTLDHFNLKQTTSYHIMFFISFLFHVLFLNLNHIISNRINQCQIYHIIPNIVSCHNIYRFTSCHSQSYDFMSFLDPSHIIWNHYHIISHHTIPYNVISYHIICHVISCIISYRTISYQNHHHIYIYVYVPYERVSFTRTCFNLKNFVPGPCGTCMSSRPRRCLQCFGEWVEYETLGRYRHSKGQPWPCYTQHIYIYIHILYLK